MGRVSYQTFLLSLGETRAEVVPSRGALLTRLTAFGRDLLYMDYDTLGDPTKNVRGGVPLLFPFAGRLPDDRFVPPGAAAPEARVPVGTPMKQHGFGRDKAWKVEEDTGSTLVMSLEDDEATRAIWPWRFRAEHTIRLLGRGVQLELVCENRGDTPMPTSPGWHPYFPCPLGLKKDLRVGAPGFDPARLREDQEFDFGLPAPRSGRVRLSLPWLSDLELGYSARLRHLQVWSPPGKPFACVEPFWGPAGTVLGPGRDEIAPGQAHDYVMRLELRS